ncbi:MAG TPA: FoF1 ATP synthase subunit gamma [Nitrospiria bacterium]|nr:FoF1 ATP synthase subunit gamma [Nitrospiria bacterium]
MTRRREIERRLRALGDIKDILNAMKNLSLIEMHKLTRFLATQQRVVDDMETVAADFLSFYPDFLAEPETRRDVYLLIGSERGFCGDFNETLLPAFETQLRRTAPEKVAVVAVGRRLSVRLANEPRVAASLEGPAVVEEVESVLTRLMETLNSLKSTRGALRLTVFHHHAEEKGTTVSVFQPFKQTERRGPRFPYPPRLNLSPHSLMTELVDHYLLHHIHGLFYGSLMAENLLRQQHMDHAIRTIEQDSFQLFQTRNRLRQEEITEEIEVIMLSLEALKKT